MREIELVNPPCEHCGRMLFPGEQRLARGGRVFCSEAAAEAHAAGRSLREAECPYDAWATGRPVELDPAADPVTLAVFDGALQTICAEMAKTMERTAHSPVFFEGKDFTVAIFDPALDRVAQHEGLPAQMGSMQQGVAGAIRQFGWEALGPGDVLIHNNSYTGTPHLPEFCMVRPMFLDGEPFAVFGNIAHHTDVGGKAPGSMPGDSTDIHQEGVIVPPVKLFVADEPDEQIWRLILSNVRSPRSARGDLMAMYGSLATAESRLRELVERYGPYEVRFCMRELQTYAERRMRAAIREIPNGVYRASRLVDDDGVVPDRPYRIEVAVTVDDEDVTFDFRGSDVQARGPINCPYGVTVSGAANAIFNLVDYTIPHNQGIFRPLHFLIPPHSLLNCEYPAPLAGGNTEIHNQIAEAVEAALAPALPERTVAPTGATTTLLTGGGVHPESGDFYTFVIWEPSGWGGRRGRDGNDAINTWVGPRAKNFPSEVLETQVPWRIERYELRADSGGAGRHRGGLGIEREYAVLGEELTVNAMGHYGLFPADGIRGGSPGARTEYRVRGGGEERSAPERDPSIVSPIKFSGLRVGRGETIVVRSPGGGGNGEPRERPAEQVLADLRDGYVSEEAAVREYGLDPTLARETVERYSWPARLAARRR